MYILEIFVDPSLSDSVRTYYEKYNNKNAGDSGIDLLNVSEINVRPFEQVTLNFGIKCQMTHLNTETGTTELSGYYLYPRSSISKTPLVLKNSVGIIDSGYRGNIKALFDCVFDSNFSNFSKFELQSNKSYIQICSPNIEYPMKVYIVNDLQSLGKNTVRGDGGFGSTD